MVYGFAREKAFERFVENLLMECYSNDSLNFSRVCAPLESQSEFEEEKTGKLLK